MINIPELNKARTHLVVSATREQLSNSVVRLIEDYIIDATNVHLKTVLRNDDGSFTKSYISYGSVTEDIYCHVDNESLTYYITRRLLTVILNSNTKII